MMINNIFNEDELTQSSCQGLPDNCYRMQKKLKVRGSGLDSTISKMEIVENEVDDE